MSAKALVKAFYESDLANDTSVLSTFLHPECTLHWNSSKGYHEFKYKDIQALFNDIYKSYDSVRIQISHMLEDGNFVSTRYTLHVRTIENPDEEQPLAHYITIWEIKDSKLFQCHEISQLANTSEECIKSFSKIKV